MNVLIGCEFSGVVRDAFIRAGHVAVSCDLLPSESRQGLHIVGDVREVVRYGDWDLGIFHPPCTRLTNSGVRWLKEPPQGRTVADMFRELDEAAEFYRALRDAPIRRKAIENPVMHRYAKERIQPGFRQVVQPWWFGEPAFKATAFELINLPPLKRTNELTPPKAGTPEHKAWSKVHREPPSVDRWKNRSRFLPGVAEAMAAQWGSLEVLEAAA